MNIYLNKTDAVNLTNVIGELPIKTGGFIILNRITEKTNGLPVDLPETETIEFTFSAEEVNFIVNVLGDLPTKSNAWPLYMNVMSQRDNPPLINPPVQQEEVTHDPEPAVVELVDADPDASGVADVVDCPVAAE